MTAVESFYRKNADSIVTMIAVKRFCYQFFFGGNKNVMPIGRGNSSNQLNEREKNCFSHGGRT